MKIVDDRGKHTGEVKFGNITVGTGFTYGGKFFLKLCDGGLAYNTFDFVVGKLLLNGFNSDTLVLPIKVEIHIVD